MFFGDFNTACIERLVSGEAVSVCFYTCVTGSFIILTLLISPTKPPDNQKQTSPSSQESRSQITECLITEKSASGAEKSKEQTFIWRKLRI